MTSKLYQLTVIIAATVLAACGSSGSENPDHSVAVEHEHGDPERANLVDLSPQAAAEAGIVTASATQAPLRQVLSLPAELRFDADRVAAVSSQVSGRIIAVTATEGDFVSDGQTLAVLSSRELADLKAEYLTAATVENLARQALSREESLFAERITPEADLQAARATLVAASAAREGVENKLIAVGVPWTELTTLSDTSDRTLAQARLRAPIGGVVARRTAILGAAVSAEDASAPALFTIVDDSVLWADIAVYTQDVATVEPGMPVVLRSETGAELATGEIATILPTIDQTSRMVTARMIVENSSRRMRPGQFVTAEIDVGTSESRLQVPSEAIVEIDGRASLFLPTADGFMPQTVELGVESGSRVVILSGLNEGELYVSEGAFTLKAHLERDSFGDDDD
jgi:membrane fusion protein, heavy metal efflux system